MRLQNLAWWAVLAICMVSWAPQFLLWLGGELHGPFIFVAVITLVAMFGLAIGGMPAMVSALAAGAALCFTPGGGGGNTSYLHPDHADASWLILFFAPAAYFLAPIAVCEDQIPRTWLARLCLAIEVGSIAAGLVLESTLIPLAGVVFLVLVGFFAPEFTSFRRVVVSGSRASVPDEQSDKQ